jgi:hypothetical protein
MKYIISVIISLVCQCCLYAQHWQTAGGCVTQGGLKSLFVDTATNEFYATGYNMTLNSLPCNDIIKWNGTTWVNAFVSTGNTSVSQLEKFQGEYYVVGTANGDLCKWNGTAWISAGQVNTGGGVFGMYNDGDSVLYVMGDFTSINSIAADNVIKYNGSTWYAIDATQWAGGGFGRAIRYQGDMYFCGTAYNSALNINSLACWNGNSWHNVGNAVMSGICFAGCFGVYNNDLYVGGYFDVATGNPGNFIARWDGQNWTQVGGGMTGGQVVAMKEFNNELWVTGQFSGAGGISATYIAKYDGIDWCSFDTLNIPVAPIEVYNGEIYVGSGCQLTINGSPMFGIAKWIGGNYTDACGHLTLGITETMEQNQLVRIFPNPVTTNAIFQLTGSSENKTLIIYDQLGKEIWRKETSESQIEFSTEGIATGLYFYRVQFQSGSISSDKLIIQ